MTSPADEVRNLMKRYPSNPARTRAAIDAALNPAPDPTELEVAAGILGAYGFTAEDIERGIAEGGSISALVFRDDEDGDRR